MKEKGHELAGKNAEGEVLVFPSGKASSVVQIDDLFKLAQHNVGPKPLVVKDGEACSLSAPLS